MMKNRRVKILKCGHYDVPSGTEGEFVKHFEDGAEIRVTGQFKSAIGKKPEETTESVWVARGDFELI